MHKAQRWLASKASCSVTTSRRFSTTPPCSIYQPLPTLDDASVDLFREKYFNPERPAALPRGHFRQSLPAYERWFRPSSSSSSSFVLNVEYLKEHAADAFVPLELTRPSSPSTETNRDGTFARFRAPLKLFLEWTQLDGMDSPTRVYLAQCQLLDIPKVLRDDLPTPALVTQSGRGDVYDTNIWVGLPPTYTPLHRDPNPNLFVQLAGQKVVRLLPPDDGWALFASVRQLLGRSGAWEAAVFRGDEMMQGDERLLLDQAVWKDTSRTSTPGKEGYETILGPGDALFIPKGWWHSIKGIGNSVTASVSWPIALFSPMSIDVYLFSLLRSIIGQLVVQVILPSIV